ncbi:glycosyltransferase family 2 protein [Paenibacillus lactis]|uniref:glycosyltransferase family 2 protein n=1 Tax=Paenibacillus lactis TaxID=228574 RepID=UPI0036C51767
MKVSVVIPNYNGEGYLRDCLTTLNMQTYKDFEIILVDNGSDDCSVKLAQEIIPNIKCIKLEANSGFSKAVNIGIRQAQGIYVVLLNNDTILTKTWLERLVHCIENNRNAFSVGSKMIQHFNRMKIDNAGDALTIFGSCYQEGHGSSADSFTENRSVFTVCAGAAIYRKDLLIELGLFDEEFFAYLEDVDIGYRARINGYENIYCSQALLYHIGSATTGSGYNSLKVKLSSRNNVYLLYKNMPILQLILNAPFILLGFLFKARFYKAIGFYSEYIEGIKEGVKTRSNVKKNRYELKKTIYFLRVQGWLLAKGMVFGLKKVKQMMKIEN